MSRAKAAEQPGRFWNGARPGIPLVRPFSPPSPGRPYYSAALKEIERWPGSCGHSLFPISTIRLLSGGRVVAGWPDWNGRGDSILASTSLVAATQRLHPMGSRCRFLQGADPGREQDARPVGASSGVRANSGPSDNATTGPERRCGRRSTATHSTLPQEAGGAKSLQDGAQGPFGHPFFCERRFMFGNDWRTNHE